MKCFKLFRVVFDDIIFGFRYNVIFIVDKYVINLFIVWIVKFINENVNKWITKYCFYLDDLTSRYRPPLKKDAFWPNSDLFWELFFDLFKTLPRVIEKALTPPKIFENALYPP